MKRSFIVFIKLLKYLLCNIFERTSNNHGSNLPKFLSISARKKSHLSSPRDVFFDVGMSFEILSELESRLKTWVYDGYSWEKILDRAADDRVVGASKDERFDVGVELHDVLPDHLIGLRSIVLSSFDGRNQIGCSYFLDLDGIVMEMYTVFVGSDIDGRLGCKNPYFSVSSLEYFLGTRYGHSQDLSVRKTYLLEVLDGVCGRGVACEYDYRRALIEEELDPFFCILPYRLIVSVTIGTARVVAEIAVIVLWEEITEFPKNRESSESRVEESDHGWVLSF